MRACEPARFSTNQSLESALLLTNQVAPVTSIFSPLRCTRTHFNCRLPASHFNRWFGVSPISLSLGHFYTTVLVTVNTQYLSSQRLSSLSFGAQLILETTRGCCWKLVFIGLWCSNPPQYHQLAVMQFQGLQNYQPVFI